MLYGVTFLFQGNNLPVEFLHLFPLLSEVYLMLEFRSLHTDLGKFVTCIDSTSGIKRLHQGNSGIESESVVSSHFHRSDHISQFLSDNDIKKIIV